MTLWDVLLDGRTAVPHAFSSISCWKLLPRETDELNVQRILGYLQQDYWKFTSDAKRTAPRAPLVERVLRRWPRQGNVPAQA